MILSIPIASMEASACSFAPWEIDSMEITLPTPKMMPSEVRDGRMGNKLQKKHARIDPQYTKELEEMTGRDFSKEDVRSITNLPTVIRLANALYGKNYSVRKRRSL